MAKVRRKRIDKTKSMIRSRIIFLTFLILLGLLFVGVFRVYQIKNNEGKKYENAAIYNQINKVRDTIINPNRGSILDRNNKVVAVSLTVYNVILDVRILVKNSIDEQNKVLTTLSEMLDISFEELLSYTAINPATGKPAKDTNWLIIAKKIPFELGKEIEAKNLKAVYLEEDTKRDYPFPNFSAQVLGFIRGDASWGIESLYNEYLVGTPGRIFRTYEADNSVITREEPSIEGNSIITTLDLSIQQFAENLTKSTYDEIKANGHKAELVSLIAMNPNSGEVLAMSEYPTFNLNDPTDITVKNEPEYKGIWETVPEEEKFSLRNKAWKNFNITETYEPGSIFKPMLIAMALEEGIISMDDVVFCNGSRTYGEHTLRCYKRAGHGNINIEEGIAYSCNVVMMEIAERLKKEKFYRYEKDFGFGEKTGIDLPGEVSASNLIYSLQALNESELATSSFGQGFNCTPIQIISAFASVINGGNLMRPYTVSQIVDSKGSVVYEKEPEIVRKVLTDKTSDQVRKVMQSTIEYGTGKKAKIEGYSIGGKTGTAEQGIRNKTLYSLSFVGYLPVENPEYLVMGIIHRPENYSDGAVSPIGMVRSLFQEIINYKAIPPTSEVYEENSIKLNAGEKIIKNYVNSNLKNTIRDLGAMGIDFQVIGGGGDIVTKQFPVPNSKIQQDTKILIYSGSSNKSVESKLVSVPDVNGMNVNQAKELIESLGFEFSISEDKSTNNTKDDTKFKDEIESIEVVDDTEPVVPKVVYEQIPSAGINLEKGTIIKVKVS